MKRLSFAKYHGTGNDFILIDNRQTDHLFSTETINKMCHRRFGIGADGLMLLNRKDGYDFEMVYYNADGREGTMCGNGGRCMVAFAHRLGIVEKDARFAAIDGEHVAEVIGLSGNQVRVKLKLKDVDDIQIQPDYYFLDTGSPHYVTFVNDVENLDVYNEGRKIRYHDRFAPAGTNVNFVEIFNTHLFVRTYERGVEDETYSCGTGIVASALATALKTGADVDSYEIKTRGGELKVYFNKQGEAFRDIWLEGPVVCVFNGEIGI
ncbi:MAG: diaminopimelate epimerase [Deltaproteobacteria bacterium]|nr:diaminopimelate epimerase [Deltaproteobacteria bacterium]MBW2153978.1 diaminopimelate epimerase [Deltaproteobacteria bacterium]